MGFKYYCYLCMHGQVFEVTEWGACQVGYNIRIMFETEHLYTVLCWVELLDIHLLSCKGCSFKGLRLRRLEVYILFRLSGYQV